MPHKLYLLHLFVFIGAVFCNEMVYVLGVPDNDSKFSVKMFNPYTKKWTKLNSEIDNIFKSRSIVQAFALNKELEDQYLSIG